MSFRFDPAEEPQEYWPEAVSRYQAVLCVALVLAGLGVTCFVCVAVVVKGEALSLLDASCAAIFGIGLALLALHGALPNIEQAQIWTTKPPI